MPVLGFQHGTAFLGNKIGAAAIDVGIIQGEEGLFRHVSGQVGFQGKDALLLDLLPLEIIVLSYECISRKHFQRHALPIYPGADALHRRQAHFELELVAADVDGVGGVVLP